MNRYMTDRAKDAMFTDWTMYTSADLLRNGAVFARDIALEDATVHVDATANVRRTFSATIANPSDYMPLNATGALSPFSTEIQLWSGIVYDDGTIDRWPIFTGALEDPAVADSGDLVLTITASDRAQNISERRLSVPYTIGGPLKITDAIAGIIDFVRPGIVFEIHPPDVADPDSVTVSGAVFAELDDPWQHAMDLAAGAGMEVFFDGAGYCIIRPIPDPSNQISVWSFAEGKSAIIKTINNTLSAKSSYSHAIAKGNPSDGSSPVRGDIYDTDPTSPTYFDPAVGSSTFGDKPVELVSELITTGSQARAAATGLLARQKGAVQNVTFTCAPVTGLDENDLVTITRERLGLSVATFMLSSFDIGCTPDAEMNPTCRSKTLP